MAKHVLSIMNHSGDEEKTWDPSNRIEVAEARELFDSLRRKGHTIYRTQPQSEVAHQFDPAIEELIAVPVVIGG